ncbi:hypothetical protein MYSTI_07891 [Myxococcus stipitatus DSM 14675]|uniref:Uncharacterized protein n=1 Tax=Myxococcus stipitatus (strain DSM 14675 / JCM 12634 / Mx s8) TaxID=1278073 RepID=L7UMB8_MYXSD|nr:DUF5682 family protein [Myxococcus stipitatus]AGC49163.1 hypothetical protein MYSTI_07891 [Myxococcus stipitatus DSM 14675]
MDLDLLTRVHLFPVRHHSPRTTAVLGRWLEHVKPEVVLIEGPCDASALVDVLCDADTRPPIALLGYRTDDTPGSALWPFAEYSPEYAALRWAQAHAARALFIDIPVGVSLAMDRRDAVPPSEAEAGAEAQEPAPEPEEPITERFARERGYRSFEELWEALFEAPDWTPEGFRSVLLAWADVLNAGPRLDYHRWRDAFMARQVLEVVARGVAPEKIAVVAGAAHVAAFVAKDVEAALEARLPAAVPCAVTVIPYSFPRLSEQLGYGAGNRAPHFYQKAHEAKCDFRRATLEVLIDFAGHLRMRGFTASLSDVLEAYRLAVTLSDLREKTAPGLDELREATIATLCRGDATHVDSFLWKSVVGHQVGRVASRIGKNSLQAEFWREVDSRHLPRTDSPETFTLRLSNEVEVGSSVFLHRLRVAGIPYATLVGTAQQKLTPKEASAQAALTRVRESWQAQWTPSTDVALVEKIVLGDSLEAVTTRVLQEQLDAARSTGGAAEVLLESVITGCAQTLGAALRACDAHASTDVDLPSLASAARALSGLVAYGTSRAHTAMGDEAVAVLCQKTFTRALLRVHEACACAPDAVPAVMDALRTLHEVALAQPLADKAGWLTAARELMRSGTVHPSASGLATGLLYLSRELTEEEVSREVGLRLSLAVAPEVSASWLEGFLRVNALVLVKNRDVVKALDEFLVGIDPELFRQTLPVLRRALGVLGSTERRYLMENIVAVRRLGEQGRAVKTVLEEKDKEKLKDMSAELGKALDDLDDLL